MYLMMKKADPELRCSWYSVMMKKSVFILFFLLCTQVEAAGYQLTAQQWAVPRSTETILAMPVLVKAVQELQATPGARLVLHYPGGDAGTLWMNELHSWLVALGIPTATMEIVPGSSHNRVIELEVLPPLGITARDVRNANETPGRGEI